MHFGLRFHIKYIRFRRDWGSPLAIPQYCGVFRESRLPSMNLPAKGGDNRSSLWTRMAPTRDDSHQIQTGRAGIPGGRRTGRICRRVFAVFFTTWLRDFEIRTRPPAAKAYFPTMWVRSFS